MATDNKIKYNIKNVHVARLTMTLVGGTHAYSYGTPRHIPGSVSLSLDAEGEMTPFYADGIVYFRSVANNGYSGDLEIALVPDWFREEFLNETKDANGVLIENANNIGPVYFALLFEFDGDRKAVRRGLLNCAVSTRPTIASETKEDTIEPGTETLAIVADPREDGMVKTQTTAETTDAVYNGWYSAVYEQGSTGGTATLTALSVGTLTLTPTFDDGCVAYTTETTNAKDAVTATAATGTSVAITVNGDAIASGSDATWEAGANTVRVEVSAPGKVGNTYYVTVVRS